MYRKMKNYEKLLILITALIFINCNNSSGQEKIMTVTGEISTEEMGTSLIHEHVMVDWIGADSSGYHRWDKSKVVKRVLPFLMKAKAEGVDTFFECTPAYLGRDPGVLKELAEKTGLNIVTNTGYYGARDNKFIPEHAFEDNAEEIARVWIDEFKNGIEESGVYPGFIKISVQEEGTLSLLHQKLVKAAALTHKATGLTIVSHTGTDEPAFEQIEILRNEGVSPEAFVWTHAQMGTLNGNIEAANQGAWISLDNVSNAPSSDPEKPNRIEWFIERLTGMKKERVLNKLLISHDSGWYTVGENNGGDFSGYTDMFRYLIPSLKENGFTREDIHLLLVENPKKAYGISVRKVGS